MRCTGTIAPSLRHSGIAAVSSRRTESRGGTHDEPGYLRPYRLLGGAPGEPGSETRKDENNGWQLCRGESNQGMLFALGL
jgi:hypothetical protein